MSEQEYLANTDPSLGEELLAIAHAHMKPNPRSTGLGDYAYVEMVGDVPCPLLDNEGLCAWVKHSGRHVCSTCANFPCTTMLYQGDEYLMPSGGCEAVLESLLTRTEPIHMVNGDGAASPRNYYVHITQELVEQRPLLGWYPQLTSFGLTILQDRSRPLDQRVAHLLEGLALIDHLESVGRLDALSALLEEFVTQTPARAPQPSVAPTPWLPVFVCGEVFSHYCHSSAHAPTALRILEGLGATVKTVQDADGTLHSMPQLQSREAYPAKRANFDDFFDNHAIFFEHVTVGLYLKMLLPVREPGVWAHATYFAAMYAAIKGAVVGFFAPKTPTDQQLVDVLVEAIRMGVHSELMYPTICARLKAAQLTSLQAMQTLVQS